MQQWLSYSCCLRAIYSWTDECVLLADVFLLFNTSFSFGINLLSNTNTQPTVYASRTHSQLAKVVKELKSTRYRPKTCVLGSRQQMCVHPKVSKMSGTTQIQACRSLVSKQECKAHLAVEGWCNSNPEAGKQLLDIEDLVKIGKNGGACPFFVSKELQKDAELVILPYNYLVDPKIRKGLDKDFDWSKCTLIFDEAHNLERVCTDAASFDLTSVKLSQCIGEVQSAIEYTLQKSEDNFEGVHEDVTSTVESFKVTKSILCNLEKAIASHQFPTNGDGLTFEGSYIFKLLARVEVTPENFELFLDQLGSVRQALEERDEEMTIVEGDLLD